MNQKPRPEASSTQFALWDLPTRLFHWSLPLLLPLAWWTAENDNYDAHQWLGYTLLVLVSFRIAWGIIGSRHARFVDFLRGPGGVVQYLRGEGAEPAGHNPLGGWAVVLMLVLLFSQALSGLFNSDEVFYSGPLYYWASGELRDAMGAWHEIGFNALIAMVCLHLLAIAYYQLRKRQPLLRAMLLGRASGRSGRSAAVSLWRALFLLLVVVGMLWTVVALAPQPPPMW